MLGDFGTACAYARNVERVAETRAALRNAVGEAGLLDAAGTVAMFSAITRIVDLTGHRWSVLRTVTNVTQVLRFVGTNKIAIATALIASVAAFIAMR